MIRDIISPDPGEKIDIVTDQDHVKKSSPADEFSLKEKHNQKHHGVQEQLPVAERKADAAADGAVHESAGVGAEIAHDKKGQEESHPENTCETQEYTLFIRFGETIYQLHG